MNVVEVSGLTHKYGRMAALRDVSFEVPEGALEQIPLHVR